MKGLSLGVFFVTLCLMAGGRPADARKDTRKDTRIGVLIWSEQARYRESLDGIMDELKKCGFNERSLKVTVENAQGSRAKLAEVAHQFAAAKLDLVVAIGTTATLAVAKECTETPVVFTEVYDPVGAGITRGWKSSGNNITGSSSKVSMATVLESLKSFAPVRRVAVLYTPGEKNSEAQLKELQGLQSASGIKVIPVIVTRDEEMAQIIPGVTHMAEAIYLTGSSVVGNTVPLIAEAANRSKVVTVTHLDDLVDKGGLLGVCPDAYRLGRLAGGNAVKILKGAKPSSLPIETVKKLEVILNMGAVKAGRYQVPPSFMKKVTKTQ